VESLGLATFALLGALVFLAFLLLSNLVFPIFFA
jgi:hypothetical protein